jgi:hypothetical protein
MGEIGRSRPQRAIQLVWGIVLVCVGGLLLWGSAWPMSAFIANIRDGQYTAFAGRILLLLLGFMYIGTGQMLFRIRQEWAIGWRMVLGLLTGLLAWFVLQFLVNPLVPLEYAYPSLWIKWVAPVLLAGGLAGCIARRYGLVWGGVIGLVQDFVVFWGIWLLSQSTDMPRHPFPAITKAMKDWNLVPSILIETIIILLIGLVSGYMGQFLAQRVLRHRSSKGQETSALDRQN